MKENYYPETMTIRLPSFLYRNIVAEVSKRNFRKKNGERNDNVFLNRVLSNMLAYRAYKKEFGKMPRRK